MKYRTEDLAGEWITFPRWDARWEPVAVREYTVEELDEMTDNVTGGVTAALHAQVLVLSNRLGFDDDLRIDRVHIGSRSSVREPLTVTFYRWVD